MSSFLLKVTMQLHKQLNKHKLNSDTRAALAKTAAKRNTSKITA